MPTAASHAVPLRQRVVLLAGSAVWVGLTGVLDFRTGVELRIFPLYFVPICIIGWYMGLAPTLFIAWLSAGTWLVSNLEAGMQYTAPVVWVVNTITQGVSFSVVGGLMVLSRRAFRLADARSRTDSLTGLLNGRAFTDDYARLAALCARHGRPITVTYIDVDDFKRVNDQFGHAEGDRVLAVLGEALQDASRETDIVARLGGDEFAMALAETDVDGARVVLDRLRDLLERALAADGRRVTLSIGAIVSQSRHPPVDDLLRQADALLYQAKQAGKDRFVVAVAA